MVEFSYQWYKDTCKAEGHDPDDELPKVSIEKARECSVKMKTFMDAQKSYTDETVQTRLSNQINEWNNKRIGHMLDALQFAEIIAGQGKGFNEFLKRHTGRRRSGGVDNKSLTPLEKRVNDRWNDAMERMKENED